LIDVLVEELFCVEVKVLLTILLAQSEPCVEVHDFLSCHVVEDALEVAQREYILNNLNFLAYLLAVVVSAPANFEEIVKIDLINTFLAAFLVKDPLYPIMMTHFHHRKVHNKLQNHTIGTILAFKVVEVLDNQQDLLITDLIERFKITGFVEGGGVWVEEVFLFDPEPVILFALLGLQFFELFE